MRETSSSALDAARQQLEYWRRERDIAARQGRRERLAQCESFIRQCELVSSALAGSGTAPGDGSETR
jgi:hypothetical protein